MATDTTTARQHEALGPCGSCGAPLALDQRYCLGCGARGPAAQAAPEALGGGPPSRVGSPRASGGNPNPPLTGGQAAFGAAVIVLVLGVGVVIGKAADDDPQPQQAQAPVVNVGGGSASNTSASQFRSDWPKGKKGYTVALQTLSKDGTSPAAVGKAKGEAETKGATDVGALDSGDHASLKSGNYVVYSGVFDKKAQAEKALKGLKGKFSSAKVIEVSRGSGGGGGGDPDALSGKKKETTVGRDKLKELDNLSPEEYSKKSRKLPETTKLPGKAPPKDNKAPGAGSEEEVIE